jgi:hypothetical protein
VAQWRSHPSEELHTQGIRFLGKNIAMLLCIINLICIVCVLVKRNKGIGPRKLFLKKRKSTRTLDRVEEFRGELVPGKRSHFRGRGVISWLVISCLTSGDLLALHANVADVDGSIRSYDHGFLSASKLPTVKNIQMGGGGRVPR